MGSCVLVSALVCWCLQTHGLAGLKRPREGFATPAAATPAASAAPSPAVASKGGLLTPGVRAQNGFQPLRLKTPGVQNSSSAPLRTPVPGITAGTFAYTVVRWCDARAS